MSFKDIMTFALTATLQRGQHPIRVHEIDSAQALYLISFCQVPACPKSHNMLLPYSGSAYNH